MARNIAGEWGEGRAPGSGRRRQLPRPQPLEPREWVDGDALNPLRDPRDVHRRVQPDTRGVPVEPSDGVLPRPLGARGLSPPGRRPMEERVEAGAPVAGVVEGADPRCGPLIAQAPRARLIEPRADEALELDRKSVV